MFSIALAQIGSVVGAFEENLSKIKKAYELACQQKARLMITPELSICGYPPYDLIDRPEMFERNEKALQDLLSITKNQKCALAVGHIAQNKSNQGRLAQNKVTVIEDGRVVFSQAKTLLPTYDVFDEARYFEPASEIQLWECDGLKLGFAICEDLWARHPGFGRKLYGKDPIEAYRNLKADVLLALSSSPYEWGKSAMREKLHQEIASDLRIPLLYVNQMGATDEILFDGGSFACNGNGELKGRLPFFRTGQVLVSLEGKEVTSFEPVSMNSVSEEVSELDSLTRGLVTGIREYFEKTGFKKAVLGLSGGIDSAVVATLAVQALGAENVTGVAMPSQYSSGHSLEDAEILARNLRIPFEVRPIKFLYSTATRELSEKRGTLNSLALENLQARLRGLVLMTYSNHDFSLVLTTGNKSEIAMGYCTLYGDMVGGLAPIGDVFKTRVYEMARYVNKIWGAPIPERTISKAPSAELRPNQTDQDTLPPYEILDAFLADYLENNLSISELEKKFGKNSLDLKESQKLDIRDLLRRLELNEYKRRQSAPILKISHKAFGIGRRVPLAKIWDKF